MSSYPLTTAFLEQIQMHFTRFHRQVEKRGVELKQAAVAIVLVEDSYGEASFLLTVRSPHLNAHGGQWALPGGRLDKGETNREAAARELSEELGLELPEAAFIGELDAYPTRSGYLVTPVVFWGGKTPVITLNPEEVASVHWVNLRELEHQDSPEFYSIPESDNPAIRMFIQNTWIHAPTAALLHQFHQVVIKGNPIRVDHLEQPVWAWR